MQTLIERFRKNGISIALMGDTGLSAKPLNLLTEKDKGQLSKHKSAIVEYLKDLPEDPAQPILQQLGWTVQYVERNDVAREIVNELVALGRVVFGLDIETYGPSVKQGEVLFSGGLDPHLGGIRSIQIAAPGKASFVFDLAYVDPEILPPLLHGLGSFVAYNAGFEYGFLKKANLLPPRLGCAMMMARLVFGVNGNKGYFSLAATTEKALGITVDKATRGSDWSIKGPLSRSQVNYGALDAVLALELTPRLMKGLRKSDQVRVYQLITDALPVVNDVILNGVGFNRKDHQILLQEWDRLANESLAEIRTSIPGIQNPNSTKQLATWLEINLPSKIKQDWPRTDTGQLKTGADALSEWPECPEALIRYKEYNKLVSSFGHGFADHIHPVTGRIHASFWLMGTRGGRFSCSKPNIQNPPRKAEFRALFVPTEGYEFVVADFSQIELRVCAILAEDETMKQAYREGIDLHRLTAANAAGCDLAQVSDQQRQEAKAINFGLIYGMSAPTLVNYAWTSYRVRMELDEAERFRRSFFDHYRGIARWHESVKRSGGFDTTVRTNSGLIRDMGQESFGWKFTNACNTPVQGSAAEVLLASLARLPKALSGLDAQIVNHVHDEILIECHPEDIHQAKQALVEAMTAGFLQVFPEHRDMTKDLVEAKSGSNWHSAKTS
jgi:DNA polymerase-1